MSHKETTSANSGKSLISSGILPNSVAWKIVLVAILLIVFAFWMKGCNDRRQASADTTKCLNTSGDWVVTPANTYRGGDGKCIVGTKPAPAPAITVVRRTGQERTLYRFPADGCITKFLRGNWSDYPKGGAIEIISVASGEKVTDEPGTSHGWSLPAGDYKVCKAGPGAWGVEIWE